MEAKNMLSYSLEVFCGVDYFDPTPTQIRPYFVNNNEF